MIYRASLFYLLTQFICCLCVSDESSQIMMGENDSQSVEEYTDECRKYQDKNCSDLSNLCLKCELYDSVCVYGEWYNKTCTKRPGVICQGEEPIVKLARCVFCYQTERWEHTCNSNPSQLCNSQMKYYRANCTVKPEVMCLGSRKFNMRLRCNVTRGHRWSTALLLSITLGGFGADRFYLGHWQEGIGKLFSFGGLGVWTLVDVLLIAIRYLGPADGSLYV